MKANIIKKLYWENLTVMKKVLSLYEYKAGKDSEEYKFFKQQVMDFFFLELNKFYKELMKEGSISKCDCGASIRRGYSSCVKCGGSGYCER